MENAPDIIKCPCCGEAISANAKKCKHCKEWIDDFDEGAMLPVKMDYVTHELTTFQKLLQVYWMSSKKNILKRFKVEDDVITIETMNNASFVAPVGECEFSCTESEYGRHWIVIRHGEQKVKFQSIPWMLSDEEWGKIVAFCSNADNSSHIGLKILSAIHNIVREVK